MKRRVWQKSVLGQTLWTLANFATVSLFAHILTPAEFGVVSIVITAQIFIAGLLLASSVESLAIATQGGRYARAEFLADSCFRACIFSILALAIPALLLSLVWPNAIDWRLASILTIGAPLTVLAEFVRGASFAIGDTRLGHRIAFLRLTVQGLVLVGLVFVSLSDRALLVALAWALGATAAVLSGAQFLVRPSMLRSDHRHRRRVRSLLLEYLGTAGPQQVLPMLVAGPSGVAAAGQFRAMQSLYGPLNVALSGLRTILLPSLFQLKSARRVLVRSLAVSTVTGGLTLIGTVMLISFPTIGSAVMGDAWPSSSALVGWFGVSRVATAVIFGAVLYARYHDMSRLSLTLRLITAFSFLGSFLAGLRIDPDTAMRAGAVALVGCTALWWLTIGILHSRLEPRGGPV